MKPRSAWMKLAAMRSRASPPTRLRGRWLFIARVVWITVAVLAIGLFVAGLPVAYAHYHNLCATSACEGVWRLKPGDVRALKELRLSPDFYAAYNVALEVVQTLGFWALAGYVFWRRSDHRLVLFLSLMLISFGTIGMANSTLYALEDSNPVWQLPVTFVETIAIISFFTFFYLFPDGRFVPRWTRWLVVVLVTYQVSYIFFDRLFDRDTVLGLSESVLLPCLLGSLVFAQIYRYRRVSGPIERQQTKWVVFGLTVVITLLVGTGLIWSALLGLTSHSGSDVLYTLVGKSVLNLSLLLIPLSIAIAILRYRLWDIDVIINRTLVFGSLAAAEAAVFAITDQLLQYLFFLTTRIEESWVTTFIALLVVAVVFEPLRRRIQTVVDRFVHRRIADYMTSESPR